VDQLQDGVEIQYRKNLSMLIAAENRLSQNAATTMAAKYIDKLIPAERRIMLPEISMNAKDEAVTIEFIPSEGESLKYEGGIEKSVIQYLQEKTGLYFVSAPHKVHPIVPETMRELVNLFCLFANTGKHREDDAEKHREGLGIFDEFFCDIWVPNHLDHEHASFIKRLRHTNSMESVREVYRTLLNYLDNYDLYSMSTFYPEKPKRLTDGLKEEYKSQLSLGDAASLINFFEMHFVEAEPQALAFAIRTVLSIKMNLIASNETLYEFVGGSIWGKAIELKQEQPEVRNLRMAVGTRAVMPRYGERRSESLGRASAQNRSRSFYKFSVEKYLGIESLEKISGGALARIDDCKLLNMLFLSNASVFAYGNWSYASTQAFSIENIFVSSIFPQNTKIKEGYSTPGTTQSWLAELETYLSFELLNRVVKNLELSEGLYSFLEDEKNRKHVEKKEKEHFLELMGNINLFTDTLEKSKTEQSSVGQRAITDKGERWLAEFFESTWEAEATLNSSKKDADIKEIESLSFRRRWSCGVFLEFANQLMEKIEKLKLHRSYAEKLKALIQEAEVLEKSGQKISYDIRGKYETLRKSIMKDIEKNR